MSRLVEFACGLLFGLGLLASGMTDPAKVIGFLDLAGAWDPSLAFVMGGAIAVGVGAFAWARRRSSSLLGGAVQWPTRTGVDAALVTGNVAFGLGWGLAGFCPGPALVSLASGHWQALVFVAAMCAGMWLHDGLAAQPARTALS